MGRQRGSRPKAVNARRVEEVSQGSRRRRREGMPSRWPVVRSEMDRAGPAGRAAHEQEMTS